MYKSRLGKMILAMVSVIIATSIFTINTNAESSKTEVAGNYYEFDKDSHYEFSTSKEFSPTAENDTYGSFMVDGNIIDVNSKNGVPAYQVEDGNLKFFYNYGDTLLLNADKDSWHLVEDKSKKLDDRKLDENILHGGMILQTSNDRKNWIDVVNMTDAFNKTPVRTEAFYESTDVQLINGCYYRMLVVYELQIRTKDSNFLFINTDKFEQKKCAEIYEFYAYTDNGDTTDVSNGQTYSLGSKVRVSDFDSYSGEEEIKKGDPHYGYDIGDFFVSGYTAEEKDDNGDMVFLKNVGDKVTLWFRLNEDINKLNGNKNLSVTADTKGSDQYFETPTMNFGRGTLIIRYTDHNNEKAEPTYYTNYLEANTSVGADTKVQLFEEGDYEVALDYEITDNQLIDKIGHYRIFFKFSVRNGNCMVYPFDVATGSELTNSSMTENGFRLDLARSRYLKVNLKREMLAESADGLVEDTRFNGPAQDGAEYTEEGIYTITVNNVYTGQFTVKKIYVGTNNLMKAYMTTGLSIPEIKELLDEGATISDDGSIQMVNVDVQNKNNTDEPKEEEQTSSETESEESVPEKEKVPYIPIIIVTAVVCLTAILMVTLKKKVSNKEKDIAEVEGEDE